MHIFCRALHNRSEFANLGTAGRHVFFQRYFKVLGTFSFSSIGLFVALTAGAGIPDQYAGQLVLVALCAYGAYLLFFDGGVTQKALENQAASFSFPLFFA